MEEFDINDNNYPGSAGREFGVPDNNEFIVVHTAPLLSEQDCRGDEGAARGAADDWEGQGHIDARCRPAKD